ncbi:hypothetical protein [Candidatus Nitrospira neomarina]|uniref:Uncharacterized protein n=1 Tax=Candidatus Nitrospira neomarina TaxID=3020899 RepID=A0AA96GRN5_9BACT|nr:hypothetical protein [Candidatus Nitrospira neomarina]WNM64053.1 hypothetical protein PQG83_09945 [Candidatus Nitrospira neomarina]
MSVLIGFAKLAGRSFSIDGGTGNADMGVECVPCISLEVVLGPRGLLDIRVPRGSAARMIIPDSGFLLTASRDGQRDHPRSAFLCF